MIILQFMVGTAAAGTYNASLEKGRMKATAGQISTIELTINNTGNATNTFNITIEAYAGWELQTPTSGVEIEANTSETISLGFKPPNESKGSKLLKVHILPANGTTEKLELVVEVEEFSDIFDDDEAVDDFVTTTVAILGGTVLILILVAIVMVKLKERTSKGGEPIWSSGDDASAPPPSKRRKTWVPEHQRKKALEARSDEVETRKPTEVEKPLPPPPEEEEAEGSELIPPSKNDGPIPSPVPLSKAEDAPKETPDDDDDEGKDS